MYMYIPSAEISAALDRVIITIRPYFISTFYAVYVIMRFDLAAAGHLHLSNPDNEPHWVSRVSSDVQ